MLDAATLLWIAGFLHAGSIFCLALAINLYR